MPRDVVTIEEDIDEDSVAEGMESGSDDGPENALPNLDAGAAVSFMHDPVRKRITVERKVIKRKKRLTKKEESSKRKIAAERLTMGLIKPDASTDREKERYLRRIATKGVVQLFNAVAERQRTMSKTLQQKMSSKERKQATDQFRGSQFNVHEQKKKDVKEEEEEDEIKTEPEEVESEEGDLSE